MASRKVYRLTVKLTLLLQTPAGPPPAPLPWSGGGGVNNTHRQEGGDEAPTTAKKAYKKKRGAQLNKRFRERQMKREASESQTVASADAPSFTQGGWQRHHPAPLPIVLDPNDGL